MTSPTSMTVTATEVLNFWFKELTQQQWFKKDAEVDATIQKRFAATYEKAAAAELWVWRESSRGRLAEIIVLDQFARNLFRDSPRAFAADPLALALAQEAIAGEHDKQLPTLQRAFMYMPYMHSESLAIHEEAVRLFDQPGLEYNLEFEIKHKVIIEEFGRYPHRNAVLGRESSAAELEFLQQPGSSF